MLLGRLIQVDVIAVRQESAITPFCSSEQRIASSPGLNDNILWRIRLQDFVPTFHDFVAAGHDLLNTSRKHRLESSVVFQVMCTHELLYPRVGVPLLAIAFVAADVEISIGKERCHFADKKIQELIRALARRVHRRIENSPLASNLIWPLPTCQIRITNEPSGCVGRHIKLRHDTDAAVTGIFNDVSNLVLRVVQAVRPLLLKQRIDLGFHPESLIFGEMPMENVQLHCFHRVQIALDHQDRNEVPA